MIGFIVAITLLSLFVFCVSWQIFYGVGAWNLNRTIGWGYDITNFVWWVGIGHAGTLISAILLLFRQKWRTGVNRAAEAMTIFAVICAAMFPVIHVGRIWLMFYFLPLQIHVVHCGLILIHHYCGTYLRYPLISRFLYYFGTQV
jgi:molybdopterin-containing oxidoreductase family membrane subunit